MTDRIPVPGLVDLQVNGFLGIEFTGEDLTEGLFIHAARELLARGTTAFLPTLGTSPLEVLERNLRLISNVMERGEFEGCLLGFHVEGPFISPEPGARGAHPPEYILPAQPDTLERIIGWAGGHLRLLTIAAGIPGAEELCRLARSHGITVSIGHSLGEDEALARLAAAGATALTHLGNGLPNLIHRHHNPIWSGLANEAYTAMLITDGHHLPPSLIKTMLRAKGIERIAVVSDASALAGMPPGVYHSFGNLAVLEESGLLHNPEGQYMVGSSATMMQCMNHLSSLGLLSLDELVRVGFDNPLRLIGLKGSDVCADSKVWYDPEMGRFGVG